MYCEKFYGSSAAAIMHMRKKHKEGTKQEIERRSGIRVNEILKKNVTLPKTHYSQDQISMEQEARSQTSSIMP